MGTLRQRATSLSPIYFKTKEKRLGALFHTYNGGRLPVVICIGRGATACNSPMLRSLRRKKKIWPWGTKNLASFCRFWLINCNFVAHYILHERTETIYTYHPTRRIAS